MASGWVIAFNSLLLVTIVGFLGTLVIDATFATTKAHDIDSLSNANMTMTSNASAWIALGIIIICLIFFIVYLAKGDIDFDDCEFISFFVLFFVAGVPYSVFTIMHMVMQTDMSAKSVAQEASLQSVVLFRSSIDMLALERENKCENMVQFKNALYHHIFALVTSDRTARYVFFAFQCPALLLFVGLPLLACVCALLVLGGSSKSH